MLEPKTPAKGITISPKQTLTAAERVWIVCTIVSFISMVSSFWSTAIVGSPWWLLAVNILILAMVGLSKPRR